LEVKPKYGQHSQGTQALDVGAETPVALYLGFHKSLHGSSLQGRLAFVSHRKRRNDSFSSSGRCQRATLAQPLVHRSLIRVFGATITRIEVLAFEQNPAD